MKMSTDFLYSGEFVPYDTRFEMPREVYLRMHPTAPFHELEDITMQIGLSGRVVLGVKLKSAPRSREIPAKVVDNNIYSLDGNCPILFINKAPKVIKESTMETKFKNLVALANETQTVKVKFTETGSEYTYKVPRGLAVQVDDRVVVEARNKLTVANVASIDLDTDIDIDADIDYKWVIALVNAEAYDSAIAKEEELVKQLKQKRKIAAARQALDALGLTQEELLKLK